MSYKIVQKMRKAIEIQINSLSYIIDHLSLAGSNITKLYILLFITYVLSNFGGCCAYSFTGASVPEHLKSIAIPLADDKSGTSEPGLRELLTDKLIQKFIDDNTLSIAPRTAANAVLECTITSVRDVPSVITGGEQIKLNKITIGVQVIYKDLVKRKTIYEKNFSNYGEYPSGASISGRKKAIEDAVNRITEDILLDTVSGW